MRIATRENDLLYIMRSRLTTSAVGAYGAAPGTPTKEFPTHLAPKGNDAPFQEVEIPSLIT